MILATCEKKGLSPSGWGRGSRWQTNSGTGGPGNRCRDEGLSIPLCLSFSAGRSLVSLRWLMSVKSDGEGLEIIVLKTDKPKCISKSLSVNGRDH